MSLLLDALRRAAATKDGAEAERYTVPSGEDAEAHGAAAPAGDGTEAPVAAAPGAGDAGGGPGADAAGGRAQARASARAVLGGGRRRRGPEPVTVALVAALAIGVGVALAAGGWAYYRATQRDVARELAGFTPQAEPTTVAAAQAGPDRASAPAAAATDAAEAGSPAAATAAGATAAGSADEAGAIAGEPASEPAAGTAAAPAGPDANGAGSAPASDRAPTAAAGGGGPDSRASSTDGTGAAASAAGAGDGDVGGSSATRAEAPAGRPDGPTTDPEGAASRRQRSLIRRTTDTTGLEDRLARGYRALRAGDLELAADAYASARELAPRNRDALLGAAAVAQRRGDTARARRLYGRVLADHPRDPYARAGLASLGAAVDAEGARATLKRHLRADPEAPALHFALGNLYAAEQRWRDAQAAYFNAYRRAPDDPDYAYNLAVALDQLGERTEARRYYERALEAARGQTASFRRADVRRRLEQLREAS